MGYSLAPAEEVVDELVAGGVRAGLDPARLSLPGVWVQVANFTVDTLATFKAELRLQLITQDADTLRAMRSLIKLANEVEAVLPVRSARARTVLMPDGTTLPGLEVVLFRRAPLTQGD